MHGELEKFMHSLIAQILKTAFNPRHCDGP